MATFTITTPVNIDSLVGRTGGDTYTINGGTLVIDEDSRYGLNANTSAIIGTVTPSATLGGSVQLDGRAQWMIPYTGGSGSVPACNTTVSLGSASGLLIAVQSALNVAPTAPGAAMPATGFIRVKQHNGVLYGTGALTGIAATAAAGENVGWIVPVGQEGTLCLLSSLNQTYGDGSFCKGDWFTVGTTDGNRATPYQIPTNGELVWHGGVLVDRAAATTITAASWAAGVVTATSTAHGLTTGDRILVDSILPRTYRTVDTVLVTVTGPNTFTYPKATNPGAYVSGGTVAPVEWYSITNSVNAGFATDTVRGKYAWLDSTTGLLRFGNDNVTSTGGYLPATGLKIRLPNVMTANATSAAKNVNSLNPAVASRWRWYNGNLGTSKTDHMSGTMSPSVFQTGKSVTMNDCCFVGQVSITSQAATSTLTHICTGGNGTTTATYALVLSTQLYPTILVDCFFSGGDTLAVAHGGLQTTTVYDLTASRCKFVATGDKITNISWSASIGRRATFTDCVFGPGHINSSQHANVSMLRTYLFSSAQSTPPPIAVAQYSFLLQNLSTDWTIDTITGPSQPGATFGRSGIVSATGASDNGKLVNAGTFVAPIDMRLGGAYRDGMSWTRVTTTATVTDTGHNYRVGDQVVVYYSGDSAAITYTVKTITAVTTNTFDFACLNAGATSGKTISYYVGGMLNGINLSAASNWKAQNIHFRGNAALPMLFGTSDFGVEVDNVSSDPRAYNQLPTTNANDLKQHSFYATDYPVIAPAAGTLGHHFEDWFIREPGLPGQNSAVTGATWSRTTTVCTVTSTAHGIQAGALQRIWIENSSSPSAVANGFGASATTLVVIDANTFSFTCVNAGAASGTLDWKLMGDSVFRVTMTEASTTTAGQAQITGSSGQAGFTGSGTMSLPAVGDQATWTTPDFILGFDSFAPVPSIVYGGAITANSSQQQFDIEYQLDTGSGFGAWRNMARYGLSGGGASGSTTLAATTTTGVAVNDYIAAPSGVAPGTKVSSLLTGYLTMMGATSVASTPNSVPLQLTGALTIDAKLNMANWVPGINMALVSKVNSGFNTGYILRLTAAGALTLTINATTTTSSAILTTALTNGTAAWVRATNDGANTKYWTSPDGITWTQLGTTQAQVATPTTTTDIFYIGSRTTGNDVFTGSVYRVRVYSDATQTTKVFDVDFSGGTGQANYTDSVNGALVTTTGSQGLVASVANNAAVLGTLTFSYAQNESTFPSTGIKLKVRATTNTLNSGASFYDIQFPMLSTATSRARLYPQTTAVPLSIVALDTNNAAIQNARVRIVAAAGGPETAGTVLLAGLTDVTGTLTGTYGFSATQPITGVVRKSTGSPTYKQGQIAGTIRSTGYSTSVFLVKDE